MNQLTEPPSGQTAGGDTEGEMNRFEEINFRGKTNAYLLPL